MGSFFVSPHDTWLWWMYSNPCLHWVDSSQSESMLSHDRQSAGQSVLMSGHHRGPAANFSFSSMEIILGLCSLLLWGALFDENRSVISLQSLIRQNLIGLMPMPYMRLRCSYLCPPETGCTSYILRHWVPFSSPLSIHRNTVDIFYPTSTWVFSWLPGCIHRSGST
jgi:hypothetical protein